MTLLTRFGAAVLALCLSLPALAISLDEAKRGLEPAKSAGLVGETPTGYLEVIRPEGQAADIVDAINRARRDEYARIAQKHGIPVAEVEAVAGKKAIEKTPAGQYIQLNGKWVRK
ncbi:MULTISPECIES: YdbL family protein [Marinobacter]|uniref:DUF1318 domain-containing protein n=1 Tax=Marinobacter profundi TaxID=2666256 RepID=A0A2G1UJW1_9GAMM|nr:MULTISPECIES: YdbL family protein [Marinobacter]MBD3657060.1 YdbL family protein [Marinobacter sp.]PHQ14784.1 hypothetical protein CLH61_10525 [Marinobacter profundi]